MCDVLPGVFLALPGDFASMNELQKYGITHLLNIHIACDKLESANKECIKNGKIASMDLCLGDLSDLSFQQIIPIIPVVCKWVQLALYGGGRVMFYDHSSTGGATALLIGFLIQEQGMNFAKALDILQQRRPGHSLPQYFSQQLKEYEPIALARQQVKNQIRPNRRKYSLVNASA